MAERFQATTNENFVGIAKAISVMDVGTNSEIAAIRKSKSFMKKPNGAIKQVLH